MKHLIFQSRFLILLLGFLTIGISHAWGADPVTIYTNSGSTGTDATSGITAAGNINTKNGHPSPSFGCTKADTKTITLTDCDFSKYTNVNLVFDYQMSKANGKFSSFTVTQYDKDNKTIGTATTISGSNNTSYSTCTAIVLAATCTKITIVCNPADGSQYGAYVDNIKITGEPAAADPSIEAEDELLLDPEEAYGTFEVKWTAMEDVDVALYTDFACTNKITGDYWFDVELDDDKNVYYTVGTNTAKTSRTVYMQLYGIDADVNDYTKVVTVTQSGAGDGDKITCSKVDICGTTAQASYSAWSSDYTGPSGAVYKGLTAGGTSTNPCLQIRSDATSQKPASGIVTTTTGGYIRTIKVAWNTSTTSGKVLNVFGSHDSYSAVADLTDDSKKGTLLGTIIYGTSTELNITTDDYEYVGVRSNDGALYMDAITFVWEEPTTATLRFDANGKTLTSGALPTAIKEITPSMDSYTLPGNTGNAAVTGYNWMGWNETASETSGQGSIILSDPKSYKVYAIWQLKTTNITLEQDDATTSATPSVEATYSQAMPSATMPQRTGYTFNGYFDAKSGGTKYYNANGTSAKTWDKEDAAFTLHAQWTANKYKINYKDEGDVAFTGSTTDLPTEHIYDIPTDLVASSKTGYTFEGWFKDAACKTKIETLGATDYLNDITIYAKWTAKQTSITLSAPSATTAGTDQVTATYDASMPSATMPARTGYKFNGFFDAQTNGTKYYNADGTSAKIWNKDISEFTLHAQWTAEVYDITYKDQGNADYSGSNLASLPQKHTYGQETQLVDGVKAGYEFKGWFGNQECSGSPVTSILGTTYTSSFTLYAKWEEILPTSFDVDVDNLTLVYDDNNNNVGNIQVTFTPSTAFDRSVKFEAVKNEGSVVTVHNPGGDDPKLKITANKEGEAIYKITSKRDESLTKTINITVKRLPVLTWKDAKGDVVATTKATALTNGKVVLPKEADYIKTPETCDEDYDHFMGWSATQFNATTDEPTLVKDGDNVNGDAETGDKTYYAVFAKGTNTPETWTKITSADDVVNGTYAIISFDEVYYLGNADYSSSNGPSVSAVSKTQGVINVTDGMKWTLSITDGKYILESGSNVGHYLWNSDDSKSIRVGTSSAKNQPSTEWTLESNTTYGLVLKNANHARYLMTNGTTDWRDYASSSMSNSNRAANLYKLSGGVSYVGYLSSCCTGYDVTLTNEGTATGGAFAANPTTACAGETVTLTANPATGYEFVQWTVKSDDEQTSYSVTDNKFEMPANGVKVSALFGKINYTVSLKRNFESTDDTYTTEAFTYQETKALTTMATIGWTKTNYKFSGWSTTPSGSVEYVDGAEYKLEEAQNKTLYAIWTADDAQPISISQEHMTLTNAPTSISAAATQLKIDYTVATGYKITNVEVTVGGQPLSTIEYTQYQLVVNASDGFQGAINITFTVEEILYTVIIDAGTGQCSTSEVVQSAYNTNIILPATSTVTAPADWEFAGWCATQITEQTDDIPTLLAAGSAYKPVENTTIYAVYKQSKGDGGEIEYKFTFAEHEGWYTNGSAQETSTPYYLLSQNKYVESPEIDLASITSISAKVDQYSNKGKFTLTAGTYTIASKITSSGTKTYKSTDTSWPMMTGKGTVKLTDVDNGTSSGTRVYTITINCTTPSTYHYHSTPNVVVKVEVKTIADKNTSYKEGDMFNAEGIVLRATYKDGTIDDNVTEGFTWDLTEALTPANTAVVFTYKNVSTEPTAISVGTLDHIGLFKQPTKKEYTEGEDFDSKGISVRAYYSNGAYQSVTSEVTYEPSTNLQRGTTQITVYYLKGNPKEKTCTIEGITVKGKVATPIITPTSGKVLEETTVTITCSTPEATIYYTTDNTTPTTSSNEYSSSFKVEPGTTVRAYAVREGWTDSEVAKAVYAEQPVFETGDWLLVTDINDLDAGSYVIIANAEYGVAMKSYTSGDYCEQANATFSEDGSMLTYNSAFGVFEIKDYIVENEKVGISFFDYAKEQYLYYSGSSNTLKAQDNQDATAAWTISQDEWEMYITNYSTTNRKMRYNNSSTRFACYTSGQNQVQLYKYYRRVPKLIYNGNKDSKVFNIPVPTRSTNGSAIVTSNKPTRGGWEFVKWTANADGSGTVYTEGDIVENMTEDINLYAQWTKATIPGTVMAVVFRYGNDFYAMSYDDEGNISPVKVVGAIGNKVVIYNETTTVAQVTWYREEVDGGVIFRNEDAQMLTCKLGSNTNIMALYEEEIESSWNNVWTWNATGGYYEANEGRTLLYGSSAIKNYSTQNIDGTGYSDVAMFCTNIVTGSDDNWFTRDMSNGYMGTHCYPFDIAAGDYHGARFYEIAYRIGDTRIYFDQVDHVEAGVPYLVVPEDEENGSTLEAIITPYTEVEKPVVTDNDKCKGFVGSYEQKSIDKNVNYYIVYNNEFRRVGDNVYVGANRAYIDLTQVRDDDPQAGNPKAPRRISLRNSDAGTPTGINNIREEFGNPNGGAMKVFHDGSIYFIRESKIYNAQGIKIQ